MNNSINLRDIYPKTDKNSDLEHLLSIAKIMAGVSHFWSMMINLVSQDSDTMVMFPYHLIRKQQNELESAYDRTYGTCQLSQEVKDELKKVECEITSIHIATSSMSSQLSSTDMLAINRICVALKVLFAEFKDDKAEDCYQRLTLFLDIVTNLINEMRELLENRE